MSVLAHILGIRAEGGDAPDPSSRSPLSRDGMWSTTGGGALTTSGEFVDPERSLTLSTYYACLRLVAVDVAKCRWHLYRRLGENDRERARDDARYRLLHDEPNPELADTTFRETMVHWAMGWGNGYAEIVRDARGRPVSLHPVHPSRVEVKRDRSGRLFYRVRVDDLDERRRRLQGGGVANKVDLLADDMFHLRGVGTPEEGYSVARLAAESVGHAMAVRRFGAAYFGNGARLGSVYEHPGKLSDPAREHLRKSLDDAYKGAGNAHKNMLLEEGLTWKQMSTAPNDAQFIETIKATVPEVCNWFGVPVYKVNYLDSGIKANVEQQAIDYVNGPVLEWTIRLDREADRKLLFEAERGRLYAEHDLTSLLRADSKTRAEFYKFLRETGAINANQIAARENLPPVGPAGEKYLVPMNMTTLERVGEPEAKADPAAEAGAAELGFKREVVKGMIADGTIGDVIFNLTDGRRLLQEVNIPVAASAPEEPWLPVVAAAGPLVSGATIEDPDGDVVGGDVVESAGAGEGAAAADDGRADAGGDDGEDAGAQNDDTGGADAGAGAPPIGRGGDQIAGGVPAVPTAAPAATPTAALKATARLFVQAADRSLAKLASHEQRKGAATSVLLDKLAGEMAENMRPAAETLLELVHGPEGLSGRTAAAALRVKAACGRSIMMRDAGEIALACQAAALCSESVEYLNAESAEDAEA